MATERIYLSPPNVGGEEIAHVTAALESGWVAPLGPDLDAFEAELAAAAGVEYAVALASGTAALHLALLGHGVGPGDRVYCPTITFGATAFAITYTGATPVFIDSEETSWNLSPEVLEQALATDAAKNELPKAILTVDLFGRTCDYDRITELANAYKIPIIEDAAEALGSAHQSGASSQQSGATVSRPAGSFGECAVFSFNGNKIITTSGGGVLVSNNKDLVDKARFRSTQSREAFPWYEHNEVGYNYRMSNILAAIGRAQLTRLNSIIERLREINNQYQQELGSVPGVTVLGDPPWGLSNHWLTNIRFDLDQYPDAPHRAREFLESHNIESRNVWKPMHQQPVFAGAASYLDGTADAIFNDSLCLPSGANLTNDQVGLICDLIRQTLET